ncbi:ABC-type polysaccharide/polyol phosphate export system, permease component [Beggiatoa alba B18LD]|uniref:Transport permease protein n=1 Tax=Beggiatoa alba B18LD TaxID=395493 RepID=I3CJ58_9GAMM|nr:ABC transporter permease [Beggiatoa alba]EIJ43651.1 ABC-type polysaccharide/polyol phosphate export system, permease component [Beggiatoa alba B18LD]
MLQDTQRHRLARYGELILYKTYADLKAESERTYLGFLWWIFEPILYMSVFYIFFGVLLGHGTDDYVPFLLVGLTMWQWFKSCVTHGSETILNGRHLMQQVHLPKVLFPIILILTDTVKFFFILSILLGFLWFSGYEISLNYLMLIPLILIQLFFIAGVTFIIAAIIPFIPDLRFVIENFLLAVFFLSGVIVKPEVIPEAYRSLYYLNPMVSLLENYRSVLLYNKMPSMTGLFALIGISLAMVWLGYSLISRFEYRYPKVLS